MGDTIYNDDIEIRNESNLKVLRSLSVIHEILNSKEEK